MRRREDGERRECVFHCHFGLMRVVKKPSKSGNYYYLLMCGRGRSGQSISSE